MLILLSEQGVQPEELPSHERDQKVDILPHLVFKNTKDFVKDDSILGLIRIIGTLLLFTHSTSKLILINSLPCII